MIKKAVIIALFLLAGIILMYFGLRLSCTGIQILRTHKEGYKINLVNSGYINPNEPVNCGSIVIMATE